MAATGGTGRSTPGEDRVRAEVIRRHHITPRASWGARTVNYAGMERDWNYTGIAIHHLGNWHRSTPRAVETTHMRRNGWPDVGYHYMISLDGAVFEGRDIRYKGSHLADANTGRIGILLMGDFDHHWLDIDDTLTANHIAYICALVATLRSFFLIDTLGGHSEFPGQGTGCPGNALLPAVQTMRANLRLAAP